MSDISFHIDTSSADTSRSSRMFYSTTGDMEDTTEDGCTKPSQERPLILKQKAKRYHEKANERQFKPGKMSYGLRKALGLGLCDIPMYIYRMRHLGYPPGWLKKAEVKRESLSVTGANATTVTTSSGADAGAVKYDCSQLHEFAGFNSHRGYERRYDRCQELGYMEMQEQSMLDRFLDYLASRRLLGKEGTSMAEIRAPHVEGAESGTEFNLPLAPASERADTAMPVTADVGTSEQQPAAPTTHHGTLIIVPVAPKPDLASFSLGINDHRLFENLPSTGGGSYRRVLEVLRRGPQP